MVEVTPLPHQIRQAFDEAASSYDAQAQVQRAVSDALWDCWRTHASAVTPNRLLDAGCGTGYGARQLDVAYPGAQLFRLDFAPAMLAHPAPGRPVCGSLESLPLPKACIDLYWSSMALQWCDLPRALAEAARVLVPGGHLAMTTLGPGTFAEIGHAFALVDQYPHVIAFQPPQQVLEVAQHCGFKPLAWECMRQTAWYPDLRSLLRAIKGVGAHTVPERRSGLLGRQAWRRIEQAYEQLRTHQGLPAHYEVLTLVARRGEGA